MASRIVTAIGAITVDSGAWPPNSSLGLFASGIRPNTSSSASGMPSTVIGAPGSRRKSFASTAVILVSAVIVSPSVQFPAGQCDERVVQVRLLHPQVTGDDAEPREQRRHRVQHVPAARDHDLPAALLDTADLRQRLEH